MVIDPLPLETDAQTWQAIAHEQHAQLLQTRALIAGKEALIAKLTAQIAQLKHLQFAAKAESFSPEQRQLFEEALAEELASLTSQLNKALPTDQPTVKQQPKRQPLPAHLPREVIRHEPKSCTCSQCGGELRFIRDEISEQLEYVPARFLVKQHVRPQYSCRQCETVVSAPMPMQVIDKGIARPGLLAQVAVSKYADHLPLYRQQQIFGRSGVQLASSTLAGWMGAIGEVLAPLTQALHQDLLGQGIIHADETPVQMPDPGRGKTARAYIWLYRSGQQASKRIAVYDFTASRAAAHAAHFLNSYQGALMVDDYSGYKGLFKEDKIVELGCWAHVRRKFFDLFSANQSLYAQTALEMIQALYQVERHVQSFTAEQRHQVRQHTAKPITQQLLAWLQTQRSQIPAGTGLAKAIDYTLKRWQALTRYLQKPDWPIDKKVGENSIRPIALGRKNWLFAGSLSAGKRAAHIMSLIETAKLNGHDPWAYLNDVLAKLPTWPNSRIHELLPYHWSAS